MDPSRRRASSWPASGHGSSRSRARSSLPGSGRQGRRGGRCGHCLQDESLRRAIEALRSRHARTASVLRLLDVALWMLHSESTAAGNARAAASVTPQR